MKKKKTERQKARDYADKWFSKYIREKSANICFVCGTMENPTCGHLITRSHLSTRWDVKNAECQCKGCNLKHEYNPEIFTNRYIDQYGLEEYQKISKRSQEKVKLTVEDIRQIGESFKKKYEELCNG